MKGKNKSARIGKPVVFILPEGKTEQQYFLGLKNKIKKRNKIFVLPEESGKIDENNLELSYKNIEKLIKNKFISNQLSHKDLRKNFTKVFIILDSDIYKNKKNIQKYFNSEKIDVIFVNPCFEKILLYHFSTNCFSKEDCKFYEKELKKHIKNYKKGDSKQIENILENFNEVLEKLKKCKDNDELLKFLNWLIEL